MFIIQPEVNPSKEFLEIAADFSNPLDIVREAISNSFDAKAKEILIHFGVTSRYGTSKLKITIEDNGRGMDKEGLQSFFDLGNSLRRQQKSDDVNLIGEKGHGTKIYFNSENIAVTTGKDGHKYVATMKSPILTLYDGKIPIVEVEEFQEKYVGTKIEIIGYNNNERAVFNHDRIKDYIYWFTKFGSFERELLSETIWDNIILSLKGVDRDLPEKLTFGHKFPKQTPSMDKLFDIYQADAPDYFVRQWIEVGSIKKFPEIRYSALFYVEGNKAKRTVNDMIRRQGYIAPEGNYSVQERYGIWLTKDFIPVQRKNEWIGSRGTEYTKFHAFFNCQALRLTANRGSVDNTPADILEEIKNTISEIYDRIIESDDWQNLEWLEEQSDAYKNRNKEKKDLDKRISQIKSTKMATLDGITLREPRQEHGVFAVYHAVDILRPDLFPYEIIDYDTHAGIDVIARLKNRGVDLDRSTLRFVEFKHTLRQNFNHSFEKLYGIICWKISLKDDEKVVDPFGTQRVVKCIPKNSSNSFTQYFLEDPRDPHRIEIIALEEYLHERLGIKFGRSLN